MNYTEIFRVALTAILANKVRAFLTMLGIMIGVLSVILLTALVSGLKTSITSQIAGLGSNLIYVIPGKLGGGRGPGGVQVNRLTIQDSVQLKNKLVNTAEVSPVVQKVTKVTYLNKSNNNVTIVGANANYPLVVQATKVTKGRFFNNSEANSGKKVVVIGPSLAEKLFPPGESPVGKTVQVDNLRYTVVGVLEPRGSIFGQDLDNLVIIPLTAAQKQFGITNLNTIYINAKDPQLVASVKKQATAILSKRLSEDDFTVQDQGQTLETINQITSALTLGLGGIAAISLLVGGIGIMNIMLVSVTERTREIGLRKALGAKPKDILNQFLVEAVTLSGIGGLLGIIIGILLSLIINNFITTTITWWSVALSFGFSMIVGIIFGVAPAIRASRLDPIQALRYE
jgi:putative ABC transport system permease protein